MGKTITKPGKEKPVKKPLPKEKVVEEVKDEVVENYKEFQKKEIEEETAVIVQPVAEITSLPVRRETTAVALTNLDDLMRFSKAIAMSGMFPGIQDEFQAISVIELGRSIGLKPMIALQVIDVIPTKKGGVLCIRGRALAALAKEAGINIEVLKKDTKGCQLRFSRGNEPPYTASFTEEDAKRAGLLSKDNYMNYPEEMYYWRAIKKGVDVFDPGLALGLSTSEEIEGLTGLIDKDRKAPKPEKEKPTVVIKKEKPEKVEVAPEPESEAPSGSSAPTPEEPAPEPPPEETEEPDTSKEYALEFENTIKEIKMRLEKAEIKEQIFKKYLKEELQPVKPDRSFVDINKYGHLSFHHGKLEDLKVILAHFEWFCEEYKASKTFEESASDKPEEEKAPF